MSWKWIILVLWLLYAVAFIFLLRRPPPRGRRSSRVSLGERALRLLIIGATGGTGRQLVRQALEAGHQVTAVARRPAKLNFSDPKLQVAPGDVLDLRSLEAVMPGHDAVLCALGHKQFFWPTKILSEGTANIIQAMQSANVPRLICESSLGVGSTSGQVGLIGNLFVYPLILPFYSWDKLRQEKIIEESDLDWVIIRPAKLTDGAARGQYRHGPEVGGYFMPVSIARADVAAFMLEQLRNDRYLGSAVGICY